MKNVLTVVAHPKQDSFTHSLKECYLDGVMEAGYHSVVVDLYKERFQPLLQLDEYPGWGGDKKYEDIIRYQQLLDESDVLTLIYPIWWASPPAILTGWFQRIFTANYAFRYTKNGSEGLLKQKVQLITLTGSPKRSLDAEYLSPIIGILNYCGLTDIDIYPVRGIHPATPLSKLNEHKHNVYKKGINIAIPRVA